MKTLTMALTVLIFAACSGRAADPEPRRAASEPGTASTSAEGLATNAVSDLRDPFWPVGWTPPPPVSPEQIATNQTRVLQSKWEDAVKRLRVTGITKLPTGKYVATVSRVGIVEEGDVLSVDYEGMTYRWRVETITKDGMQPKRIGVFPVKEPRSATSSPPATEAESSAAEAPSPNTEGAPAGR
jgi:hypothetical protein